MNTACCLLPFVVALVVNVLSLVAAALRLQSRAGCTYIQSEECTIYREYQ